MTAFVWVRSLSRGSSAVDVFCHRAAAFSFPADGCGRRAFISADLDTRAIWNRIWSYLWAGSGLFTSGHRCHFALLTIGFAYRAIRGGRTVALTGVLLGLTFLSHFIYGYIGALTVCLLALMPDPESPRATRIGRTIWIGAIAFLVSAFELLPLLLDGSIINHSQWESVWKWDSFEPARSSMGFYRRIARSWTAAGDLASGLGGGLGFISTKEKSAPHLLAAQRHALDSVFFGRPFWGPLLILVGWCPICNCIAWWAARKSF